LGQLLRAGAGCGQRVLIAARPVAKEGSDQRPMWGTLDMSQGGFLANNLLAV
jgi:hypothetical protein